MKHTIQHSGNPGTNLPAQSPSAHSDYEYEGIAHDVGAALKRCLKRKVLKAA
jgi:hypothetical protein